MKFKVTATIPVELEINCQSKEEALDTATTILQEQRDDGDYASIVADCIESALVSGSITMTAVDDHEALVNELRTKRKISIQDMDAFLGYEIDKNDDMMFDDDYINANLWMMDVDKALGLDVCTSDNDEYVTISVNWYPKAAERPNKREIDIFEFPDADADCRFGTDAAGYLLEMTPRDGSAPARYRMAYGAAAARSDITPGHNPALFRFGVWILFNIAALPLGAVAFHSSVISYRGRGVLFLGESGTGKSTHTRLWREHIPGAELLNDDSPIIRATDSEALVHGSPWSGKTPCYRNESCPIAAVVRLSQAPHNRIRRLRPIESIGALLPSAPPAFARDERLSDDTCGLLSRLIAQVPVYHLECLPDAAAAQLACRTVFNDATL